MVDLLQAFMIDETGTSLPLTASRGIS